MLRIVYIGTQGDFTLRPLQAIMAHHNVVAIIQSAPRYGLSDSLPASQKLVQNAASLAGRPSLWTIARRHHIPYLYLTRQNIDEFITLLEQLQPDVGCIASMNQLLPERCIAIPRLGFINLHPSLLPKLRGPNAWFWYYHEMESTGGVSIIRIDRGEDTGDILKQESFSISMGMPSHELIRQSISLGVRLMLETLEDLESGQESPMPQRHLACPQRARYLEQDDDLFDWQRWTLAQTYHFLNGTIPWYRALTPAHGFLGRLDWRTTGYENTSPAATPGKINLDWKGAYFTHPQGKIRLRLHIPFWRVLVALLLLLAIFNILISR